MITATAFSQNIVALIWDFDKTLISGYMQEPLFKKFGVIDKEFWDEVNGLEEHYLEHKIRVNKDTIYLNHILTYVENGIFSGLTNDMLKELGQELQFYPGLPEFFPSIKRNIETDSRFQLYDIKLEHYIVSTGLAAMIRGSAIYQYVDNIWGCEFIEHVALPNFKNFQIAAVADSERRIRQIGYALDNTTKTRALFEINKGVNKMEGIDVNARMKEEARRVPFRNMIYIADGPSDVPAFSILNKQGGKTYAIYPKGNVKAFNQVDDLRRDGRINMYSEADYTEGSQTYMWLVEHTRKIAEAIVQEKDAAIRASVSTPPRHLVE